MTHCTYSIIFKEYTIEERIGEGANGSVDLSKYHQKSWTRAPFTNQEWVAEVGKGMEWIGNNPDGNQLLHPRSAYLDPCLDHSE